MDHFALNPTQEVAVGAENVTALPLKLIKGADVGNIPVGLVPRLGESSKISLSNNKNMFTKP